MWESLAVCRSWSSPQLLAEIRQPFHGNPIVDIPYNVKDGGKQRLTPPAPGQGRAATLGGACSPRRAFSALDGSASLESQSRVIRALVGCEHRMFSWECLD